MTVKMMGRYLCKGSCGAVTANITGTCSHCQRRQVDQKDGVVKQTGVEVTTTFHDNGQLASREFLLNGKFHRDPADGPTREGWRSNGQLYYRQFCLNGFPHRDPADGPAFESWHENGQSNCREFWLDGKPVTADD